MITVAVTSGNDSYSEGFYQTIRIWNLEKKYKKTVLAENLYGVNTVDVTSNNNFIISESLVSSLRIWNLKTRQQEAVLEGYTGEILSIAVISDNFVVFGNKKNCEIWDLKNMLRSVLEDKLSRFTSSCDERNNSCV